MMPTKSPYTPAELKKAYTLVTEHLSQALIQAPVGVSVRCGQLGAFKKTEHQITSRLEHTQGQTFVYYRLLFKPYTALKEKLNQVLEKKYNR